MKKFSPNLTDQELYDLFRNAVENYEPLHYQKERNENWGHVMAQLGDGIATIPKDKGKLYVWRRVLVLLILLFLLLGLGDVSMRIMKNGQWEKYNMNEAVKNDNAIDKMYEVIKDEDTMNKEKTIMKAEYDDMAHPQEDLVTLETISRNKNSGLESGQEKKDAGVSSVRLSYLGNKQEAGDEQHITGSNLLEEKNRNQLAFNIRHLSIDNTNKATYNILYPYLIKSIPAPGTVNNSEEEKIGRIKKQAAAGHANRKQTIRRSKWSVAVTVGTDWSRVSSKMGRPAGIDYGVMIQRRFAPRWSIETGLLLTSKLYSARPSDYHSFTNYPWLFRVNAECRVLDLPINLRYDVIQKGKNAGFISSGISSIWMQKEDYYLQSKINGSIQTAKHTFYNQNQHTLSVLNMAIGYEHTWNKMALQVSPYLKLPLKGIGYGQVRLVSSGVFISGKYNF